MEIVAFTLVAAALYLGADWLLNTIERRRGERLANRSLYFFGIILISALVSFRLIQSVLG